MYKTVLLCLFVVASLAPSSAEIVKRSKRGILDDLLRNDPHFSTKAPKVTKAPIRKTTTTTTTEVPEVITTIATPSRQQVRRRKPARNNVPKKQPVQIQDPSKFKDIKLIGLDDLTVPKRIVTLRVQKVTTKKPKEVLKKQTTPKKKLTTQKPELIKDTEVNVEEEDDDVEYVTEIPSKIAEKFRQKVDFTSDNIARKETVDEDGEIKGEYSYTDPNGKLLVVRYTAGKNGFNVEVPVEETKSSPPTATATLNHNLRIPQKTDNKEWINSLFARTPSPVRRTTTTTTTPAPTTTTTQPPTTTTTTTTPPQFVPQRRQSFQEHPRSTFGQQRFQEQPRQQQRFQEQPRSSFGQQRFQEQPRQQQRFQEQPRSGFEQQRFQEQRFEAAPQPNQFSRLESSIQKQQNSHDQFLNQNRQRLFSQPPPQQQQQQFGQFQQQRPNQQAFNHYDYDYADQSNFQTRFN